jgi:hypothetical protein
VLAMAQTLVCLRVHVIFSTKDRRPMITPEQELVALLEKYRVPYDDRHLWT